MLQIAVYSEDRAYEACRQKTQTQPRQSSKEPTQKQEVIGVEFIGYITRYCMLSHYMTRYYTVYSIAVCHLV